MKEPISFDKDLRKAITETTTTLSKAVKSTLGPSGTNVGVLSEIRLPLILNDGVTVAKNIKFEDPLKKYVANVLKSVSQNTDNIAGDGPQPLYSKVLTPSGFISMKDVKKGDTICGVGENKIQKVLDIFPKGEKEICKVTLSDGRVVECCEDHLWTVFTNYGKKKTLTLKELYKDYKKQSKKGHFKYKYYTLRTSSEFSNSFLQIDPYTLGVLLGDGSLSPKTPHEGDIEISLGKNKEHIIDKIILPEGYFLKSTWVESKNYFRVKIKNKKNVPSFHNILKEMMLLGTKSGTKFIPDNYLISPSGTRVKLLQGLLDTDGHMNKRSLFEYSTTSEKLFNNFTFLCRSLDIPIYTKLHKRDNDSGSYSNTPIYRVSELKGYTQGYKIVDIHYTSLKTEMKCIKVSNADNLYITDNFVVTHNTTTSITLAEAIILEGIKNIDAGFSQVNISKGIREATILVLKKLEERAVSVIDNKKTLLQVASISANNDKELGKIISEAFLKVGVDGQIEVRDSMSENTYINTVPGMKYDSGFESNMFTNTDKGEVFFENCKVLVYEGKLRTIDPIMDILRQIRGKNDSLLVIADDYDEICVKDLAANKVDGSLRVCAVRSPGFGVNKENSLDDIALITGADIISKRFGRQIEGADLGSLGTAETIRVSKDSFTIVHKPTDSKLLDKKVENLRVAAKKSSGTEKEEILQRIANLSNGTAVMYVAGSSPMEIAEKKYRIEDAINATRASLEEGIVPGGGVTLLRLGKTLKMPEMDNRDQEIGFQIIVKALEAPIKTIAENAGDNGDVIMNEVLRSKKFNYGYDAKAKKYKDLVKAGILDPVKVTKAALTNASSVSQLLLTMNCAIYK